MTMKPMFLVLTFAALHALPAAARTPTNNAAAFRTINLYTDRTVAVGVQDHINISQYPSTLNSDALLVTRTPGSADSVALFNSEPYDGINFEVNATPTQSYVEYAITPPQYVTSLGFLATGINIYNGTGVFNDFGKPLLRAIVTYADGDTSLRLLHVGNHARDYWDTGPLTCSGGTHPLYTTRPTDPLCGYIFEDGIRVYDVQERPLARPKWRKKVTGIRLEGLLLTRLCFTGVPVYGETNVHGLSLWPNFAVRNATSSQPVVRQSQTTGHEHGGYLFGNTIVGQRRTTDVTACKVASLAMAYTYAGFSCSVDSLNAHLQRTKGYQDDQVAIVTFVSPTGSSIRFNRHR